MSESCELCGDNAEYIDSHHVSYEPEETMRVCRSCHSEIHHTNDHPDLKPDARDLSEFYDPDDIHIDYSEIPSREGWSPQIKYTICNSEGCSNCPHGPYYYYYRRFGDSVRCEYGGKVTDEMLANQSTLADFVTQSVEKSGS